LFGNILNETLSKYNDSEVIGSLSYNDLSTAVRQYYSQLKYLTEKSDYIIVLYENYPTLACSTPCSYELTTWQTLFYLSLTIFVLALVTVLLYSIFLRKQYISLKARAKNVKYSKVDQ
jgi:hypothetical protein